MITNLPFSYFLAALAIGVFVEVVALVFGFWIYKPRSFALVTIVFGFGLVEGLGVGWVIGGRQAFGSIAPVLFMVGAVVGILFEGLNDYWLHAWTWPDRPFLGIERPIDKAAFIGFAWGFVPVISVALARLVVLGGLEVARA